MASHGSGNGPEPWLNDHAAYDRVSTSGNSAGGNIAHALAFRVGTIGLPEGVKDGCGATFFLVVVRRRKCG